MNESRIAPSERRISGRLRMAGGLALALAPILLFGALSNVAAYQRETRPAVVGTASTARPDLVSWMLADPLSTLGLPLLAFGLSLAAAWFAVDRGSLRWVAALQGRADLPERSAGLPVHWQAAAPDVRNLAETIDGMSASLAARAADLEQASAQRETLVREIHHRVKNNLQIISSLLSMQQRALTDPVARAALVSTRHHISALGLITRAYLQGPDVHQVDLPHYLEELLSQLVNSGGADVSPLEVELTAVSMSLDADRLAPLALFAVEAITNARRHGLARTGGRLKVEFGLEGGRARLAISDDGSAGLPPTVGHGIGRRLMTAFGRQLHGCVRFTPNPGGGVTAELDFPVADARPPSGGG